MGPTQNNFGIITQKRKVMVCAQKKMLNKKHASKNKNSTNKNEKLPV